MGTPVNLGSDSRPAGPGCVAWDSLTTLSEPPIFTHTDNEKSQVPSGGQQPMDHAIHWALHHPYPAEKQPVQRLQSKVEPGLEGAPVL